MNLWDIVYNGCIIDTVEMSATLFRDEVREQLIKQGYDKGIKVFAYPYED
jgi:hypothetical protein